MASSFNVRIVLKGGGNNGASSHLARNVFGAARRGNNGKRRVYWSSRRGNDGKRIVFRPARRGNDGKRNVFVFPAPKNNRNYNKTNRWPPHPVVFLEPDAFWEQPGAGMMENVMFLEQPGAGMMENVLFWEPPGAEKWKT